MTPPFTPSQEARIRELIAQAGQTAEHGTIPFAGFPCSRPAPSNDNVVVRYREHGQSVTIEIVGDPDLAGLLDREFTIEQLHTADDYSSELMQNLELPIVFVQDSEPYPHDDADASPPTGGLFDG